MDSTDLVQQELGQLKQRIQESHQAVLEHGRRTIQCASRPLVSIYRQSKTSCHTVSMSNGWRITARSASSTARRYVQVFQKWDQIEQRGEQLSLTQALAAVADPNRARMRDLPHVANNSGENEWSWAKSEMHSALEPVIRKYQRFKQIEQEAGMDFIELCDHYRETGQWDEGNRELSKGKLE